MPVYLTGSQANPSLVPHSTAEPLRSLVTRACLAIDVARRMNHQDVSKRLAELFAERGVLAYLRSDNGSDFKAQVSETALKPLG